MIAIMFDHFMQRAAAAGHRPARYRAGASLFRRGQSVSRIFFLAEGDVGLSRDGTGGEPLILHRHTGPAVVAEASLYAAAYHCDGVALTDCAVHAVPRRSVRRWLEGDAALAARWAAFLASQVQAARTRAELMTLKTVRARLDAWLLLSQPSALPERGRWRD
ncbi:MAG: Crp/Fnr family transcriptional regulator, partial [Pseudomonadota bacterium]